MTKKELFGLGAVGMLVLVGCQSGMYSSDVSVEKNNSGVSDYTVVNSLDIKEYPQSMPVVVETKSTNKKGDHVWNNLLWFFTLGIVPGITSEETIYDITVKTPIGEKSGTGKVEASSWMGWIPIFIPYPGMAEERTANPKLPNASIEGKVRDKLVANLVSQFSKSEYAGFVTKNNSPELKAQRAKEAAERERLAKERAEAEKARLAKEAAERAEKMRLAMRTALYEKTVESDLAQIRACYSESMLYLNPFLGKDRRRDRDAKSDWLSKWMSPRIDISESDALAGEALLSAFGTKYMPNAYAKFEKKKDAATEIQQIFNEEFAQPWTIKNTSPKWNSFNKVLEKLVKARTEYFICHDELCHYWMGLKLGALTAQDLTKADSRKLAVHLLPENVSRAGYAVLKPKTVDPKVLEFAAKYAPESNAFYQKFEREQKENRALLDETFKQHTMMDNARFDRSLAAAVQKNNELVRQMTALSLQLQTWYMDHKTTEKSSEEVAKCDHAAAKKIKSFAESLVSFIRVHATGPIIPEEDMVEIPARSFKTTERRKRKRGWSMVDETHNVSGKIMRFEVTQLQWMFVMGNNPSYYLKPDAPVENVSWNDCQEFIRRINAMYGSKYKLPDEYAWMYACKAGSNGEIGKRANGEEGPLSAMGVCRENCRGRNPLPVGLLEPNAWGLYDMHGNVSEWCVNNYYYSDTSTNPSKVFKGGDFSDGDEKCSASYRESGSADGKQRYRGFRLAE